MFAYIEGTVEEIGADTLTLEHDGIGFLIAMPISDLERLVRGEHHVRIYTYFQSSENGVALYGFLSKEEKETFLLLIGVNGVGPKAALAILGSLTFDELRFAILSEDEKTIARAPGIGPKSAKRIILDLKDKMDIEETIALHAAAPEAAGNGQIVRNDVVAALTALGYSGAEALRAYQQIDGADEMDTDTALKECLKHMAMF